MCFQRNLFEAYSRCPIARMSLGEAWGSAQTNISRDQNARWTSSDSIVTQSAMSSHRGAIDPRTSDWRSDRVLLGIERSVAPQPVGRARDWGPKGWVSPQSQAGRCARAKYDECEWRCGLSRGSASPLGPPPLPFGFQKLGQGIPWGRATGCWFGGCRAGAM